MTGAECCATGGDNRPRDTRPALPNASKLPLSTVLVATVGGADFSATEVPDSDSGAWRPRSGEAAIPDIVQFVVDSSTMLPRKLLLEASWQRCRNKLAAPSASTCPARETRERKREAPEHNGICALPFSLCRAAFSFGSGFLTLGAALPAQRPARYRGETRNWSRLPVASTTTYPELRASTATRSSA
ncbi:hypothetical protein E2320_022502 [Naja naja]|nr:hypothetical protein E2320_022502 [Naja naja]